MSSSGSASRRSAPIGSAERGGGGGSGSARGTERRRRNSIGAVPDGYDVRASVANLPPLRGGGGGDGIGDSASKAPPIGGKAFRQYETTVVL